MDKERSIAKIIAAADTQEAKLDAYCKIVLSHKEVLAWILKSCTKEFKDCSIKDIAYKYSVVLRSKTALKGVGHLSDTY